MLNTYQLHELAEEVDKATKPGKWFRVLDKDGKILMETSSTFDIREHNYDKNPDVEIQRLYTATLEEWRTIDEVPTTPRNRRRYSE